MNVKVVDCNHIPQSAVSPAKARALLSSGQAVVYLLDPFTVLLVGRAGAVGDCFNAVAREYDEVMRNL